MIHINTKVELNLANIPTGAQKHVKAFTVETSSLKLNEGDRH
jgi:hypothetical protein